MLPTPEHCLIDSLDENGTPVCLQCDEYYDRNESNLCSMGICGLDSNVLRKDYTQFPIGGDQDPDQIHVNETDTQCQLCKVVRGTSRCWNCSYYD